MTRYRNIAVFFAALGLACWVLPQDKWSFPRATFFVWWIFSTMAAIWAWHLALDRRGE